MNKRFLFFTTFLMIFMMNAGAQTSVKIKFRYFPDAVYPRIHFPGTFNNWGPNSAGTIAAESVSQADSLDSTTGFWVKTVTLSLNTYQYKIYRQLSSTPTNWSWIIDPLNRSIFTEANGNQNSLLVIDSLVLFQVCAYPYTIETSTGGTKFVCRSSVPSLSAGIFQPAGNPSVTLTATIDGAVIQNPSSYYDAASGIFTYKPAGLADGNHTFKLLVSNGNITKTDSVRFEVRARPVQIQTPAFTTRKPTYITAGIVLKPNGSGLDSSISSVTITVKGIVKTVQVVNGSFLDTTTIEEGQNWIVVSTALGRDSVLVKRIVNHTPWAAANAQLSGTSVILDASKSSDPDTTLTLKYFKWLDDPQFPLGLNGQTTVSVSVTKPTVPGEYYYGLIAADQNGNADTARFYFIVNTDGTISNPTIASNPEWARRGRIYFLFPKAASSAGTLNAAALRLQYIKDLGFNIIWMMPVMKNAYPINQQGGPGYNITDFYNVAPEYGTNQDFKNFISQAHALGIKVILDVTPNHTSRFHPWSVDAHTNKQKSPYWNWYEHNNQPANQTNNLGSSLDADGFNYYTGFSDQLLNYNWTDVDAREEMINVYKYWIREFGLDGYRFDVYWGPHRRYGEQYMGKPVRDALKHIKPDIFLLAEDDGTGGGTETIYADYSSGGINGGVDAAYDFKLFFNQIRGFGFTSSAVDNLNGDILNGGFYPGPNALYMRFMESQDEDRIAYVYSANGGIDASTTFMKTMPMATTIFTVPGIPMIWNGQEVGKGYGDSNFDSRRRGTIDWNFSGKTLLTPHYQRLAQIRGQFPAFTTQQMIRVNSDRPLVYSFTRPYSSGNVVVAVNMNSSLEQVSLSLSYLNLAAPIKDGKTYYANDVYSDSSYAFQFSGGAVVLSFGLKPYGSAIFVIADSVIHVNMPLLTAIRSDGKSSNPRTFRLEQNYPNPFNPSTMIRYSVPKTSFVNIKIYSVLGKEIAVLKEGTVAAGEYTLQWDGRTGSGMQVASGVYILRMESESFTQSQKIVLMK